jgi:ectoine hydroxylase-related dioxygenase (phytanoyl-CoA dioxygenase family)
MPPSAAYWDPARDHFAISVWIPLQPVTEDNGCMQFQPGSNRLPVLEHRRVDPATEGLVLVDDSPVTDPVVCPLSLGGATVHGNRTVHYTGPNRSEEPRRALIMSFASPSRARTEQRSFPWQRF